MIDENTQSKIVNTLGGEKLPDTKANAATVQDILSAVFFFAGFVALVFVIVGGFRYIVSAGDPQKAAQAKETILYAIIGLVIAMSAFTIVRLTLGATQ